MLCSYIGIELTKKGEKKKGKEFISLDFPQYIGDRVSTVARPTRRPTYRPIVSTVTRPRGAQITHDPSLSRKATVKSQTFSAHLTIGVANGTSKNVGLGKFWQDLEISERF